MESPRTERQVRSFLGKIQYINRFISRLSITCAPIFKLLRKSQPVRWNEDCQKAFDHIKEYLKNPPVLSSPRPGEPLILYLSIEDAGVGAMDGLSKVANSRCPAVDAEFCHEQTVKGRVVAGILAENPIADNEYGNLEFQMNICYCVETGLETLLLMRQANRKWSWSVIADLEAPNGEVTKQLLQRLLLFPGHQTNMAELSVVIIAEWEGSSCIKLIQRKNLEEPWFTDILRYMKNGTFSDDATKEDRSVLRKMPLNYVLADGELYRRAWDGMLLRCVGKKEGDEIMKKIHEGVCGTHLSGMSLARKIMRQGYFWVQMEGDCVNSSLVKACQYHDNKSHLPCY
ncbi:uncharacterized protein LOC119369154 [Jatropha curcas]|uniref:uncharacterized protein LOC119369154 n=1 Tax=Jatropha curcas TaxID=180498 RepID=UPI0018953EB7|nr:uncharacterized protein LOC119369154 [Jatropha curcas]